MDADQSKRGSVELTEGVFGRSKRYRFFAKPLFFVGRSYGLALIYRKRRSAWR